jgi:hypothetical protein
MRRVANVAARTAIVMHQRKSGGDMALAQLAGAGLTFFLAFIVGVVAYWFSSVILGIAATFGGIAACFWAGIALGHALKAMQLKLPTGKTTSLADLVRGIEPDASADLAGDPPTGTLIAEPTDGTPVAVDAASPGESEPAAASLPAPSAAADADAGTPRPVD